MFEEFTEEYFITQAKALGNELGVDTRNGSVYMDMAAGHCLRAAFFFANLRELFNMFALDTCYADVLDDKATESGLERHEATPAVFYGVFEGAQPSVGDRFFVENTNYYFTVIEDDNGANLLEAETDGTECNTLSAGALLLPVYDIEGLESATLGEVHTLGSDEETDDALRSRLKEKLATPAENGNRQDYKTWCESITGIGRARIEPLFAGENTVRAVLYNMDGLPADDEAVNEVQEYIDPITQNYVFTDADGNEYICGDGFGGGVANMGAHFLAVSAKAEDITVSFSVTLKDGATLPGCKSAAENAITEYLKTLVLESDEDACITIRLSRIGAIIAGLSEVLDYEELMINGGDDNIVVGNIGVPILREVVVIAAD
jgi:uncharacterized phage protein gp47/JayE